MSLRPFAAISTIFGRHPLWMLALLYTLISLALLRPTIHGNDGHGNYAFLRSMLFDGDLNFRNDYRLFDRATDSRFNFGAIPVEKASGRPGNRYGIGSAILWSPFVVPVRVFGLTRGREETGLEQRYVLAVGLGSAFWGALGLAILLMTCRIVWHPGADWMAVAVAMFLSPLPFYLFFHTSMSHAAAFFATSGFLGCWIMALRSLRRGWFVAAGALAGLAVMSRFQEAAVVIACFALGVFLAIGKLFGGEPRRMRAILGHLFVAGVTALLVFVPQMIVWWILYGSPFSGPAPYLRYSEFSLARPIHFLQTLFSSNHGLFFWHPLLAVGVIGLAVDVFRKRMAPLVLLVAILGAWYIASCWQVWWAGASFGNRFYLSVLPAFAAGWAALADRLRWRWQRRLLWALVVVGGLWNMGLAIQYGSGMIQREGEVRFATLLENQVTEVPRLAVDWFKR